MANKEGQQVDTLPSQLYGWDGSHPVRIGCDPLGNIGSNYATIIRSSGNYIYIGNALIGTASSAATWRVKRLDTTTLLDIKWADGDDSFNNIFDNYASLTYV